MVELPVTSARRVLDRLPGLVRQRMLDRQLSQRTAAEAIGVGKSTLGDFLAGGEPRLGLVVKLLAWLDVERPPEPPETLTRAARAVLDMLSESHGVGQAWLRIEPRSYGLVLPDADGTIGELHRARGLSWATWGELEAAGLVRRGLPTVVPPARGPRNRNARNEGWPVEIITTSDHSATVTLSTTPNSTEGAAS